MGSLGQLVFSFENSRSNGWMLNWIWKVHIQTQNLVWASFPPTNWALVKKDKRVAAGDKTELAELRSMQEARRGQLVLSKWSGSEIREGGEWWSTLMRMSTNYGDDGTMGFWLKAEGLDEDRFNEELLWWGLRWRWLVIEAAVNVFFVKSTNEFNIGAERDAKVIDGEFQSEQRCGCLDLEVSRFTESGMLRTRIGVEGSWINDGENFLILIYVFSPLILCLFPLSLL